MSGSFLRGLWREEAILPNTLLPAFNIDLPWTETSWASFASKVLPTGVFELKELTELTLSVVPAGIVAAFKDEAAAAAQITAINATNLFCFIKRFSIGGFVRRLVCCSRGDLHRRIDQLKDHSGHRASHEV